MKTIQISDEDHAILMELTKELQTQENDSQAFPYFWSPRSTKETIGNEDDTPMVYDSNAAEIYSLEDFAANNDDLFLAFLEEDGLDVGTKYEDVDESDWRYFVEGECSNDCSIVYSRQEQFCEQNHSLFKSDVKNFIDTNNYHLGKDPHTYANTIWRMPKMKQLVELIYRLNPQPEDEVNHEARRFVLDEQEA